MVTLHNYGFQLPIRYQHLFQRFPTQLKVLTTLLLLSLSASVLAYFVEKKNNEEGKIETLPILYKEPITYVYTYLPLSLAVSEREYLPIKSNTVTWTSEVNFYHLLQDLWEPIDFAS